MPGSCGVVAATALEFFKAPFDVLTSQLSRSFIAFRIIVCGRTPKFCLTVPVDDLNATH